MIKIENYSRSFNNRKIIDNLSLTFPDKGLIALVGASGSGKSTLLNSLGGIDNSYQGKIKIDEVDLLKLSDEERDHFRLKNIGYVFQNFNLLNLESCYTNVKLPLDALSNSSESIKKKRVMDTLKSLEISHLAKKNINKLSGGERQRVAIAKAIINSPKLILCDEPTGALDEKNSYNIFTILRVLAKSSLVIVATHDIELIKKFADQIIEIKDGKITSQNDYEYHDIDGELSILGNTKKSKKSYLPFLFKIKHGYHKIKSKKWRFLITNFMLSLSLTGIGVSLIISSNVTSKIENAFSSLISSNQIIMSERYPSSNVFGGVFSANEDSVLEIASRYKEDISGVGANYLVNFENFFKDKNEFKINANMYTYIISSLSMRNVNDFKWIDDSLINKISPRLEEELNNDQIVIGFSYVDMVNLCFHLQIQRNFESLSSYFYNHFSTVSLHVKNNDWQYEDEQVFEIKGIFESERTTLYHTNRLWNKVVFEDNMRFPITETGDKFFPWEMYKLYYFNTIDKPKVFLDKALYDESLYDYAFERINHEYNPILCPIGKVCDENRVIIYNVDRKSIRPSVVSDLISREKILSNYYFLSDLGYSSYANSLLSGFSRNIFVSNNLDSLSSAIDADTSSDDVSSLDISLPSDVYRGNFMDSLSDGVKFSTKMDLIYGRKPTNNKEIAISIGLSKKLFGDKNPVGLNLYFAGDISTSLENTKKDYRSTLLRITGVTSQSKNYLYHDNNWTISFFRDELGAEGFYLTPKSVVFELDNNVDVNSLVNKLNKVYRDYSFINPISELSKSIDSTLSYAKTILLVFSILSLMISILLLGTLILLDILESQNEIKIFEYSGINSKDISSLFVTQSMTQTFIAFMFSLLEIIVVDLSISLALNTMLNSNLDFSINPTPILIVFLIAIIVSYLVSKVMVILLFKKKLKQNNK